MTFASPYPGLQPDLIARHIPFAGNEPVLVLELCNTTPLWAPMISTLQPEARFVIFTRQPEAETSARASADSIAGKTRFLRADWYTGSWETRLPPESFHAIWVPFVTTGAAVAAQERLIGRLASKLRPGGVLLWGAELRAATPELESDYERRLHEWRQVHMNMPADHDPAAKGTGEHLAGSEVFRPRWEQLRHWIEQTGLSNVELLWKQELAAVVTGMKRV
ncbi:MAG: class I SAM-dependent methyltransferase [Deltaproteobacteria bacterium]|nr:class I SAM-dependent methyltransferase [Deltaproteobacteria bacterium]